MSISRIPLTAGLFLALPLAALGDPQSECSVDATSQIEIGTCLETAERLADATVQSALEYALQSAQELDDVTERDSSVPALTAAQAGWEAYRTAQCDFVGTTYGGGSGTGIAIRSCRIALARVRADDLMRYVQ